MSTYGNAADDDIFVSLFGADANSSQAIDLNDSFIIEELTRIEQALSPELSLPQEDAKFCHVCQRSFSTAWSKKRHMKNVHERKNNDATRTDSANNIFGKCGLRCASKWNLKQHVKRKHLSDASSSSCEPHACKQCGKLFSSAAHLQTHVSRMHNKPGKTEMGNMENKCPQCPRTFKYKKNANAHMRNDHLYQCSLCREPHQSQNDLSEHAKRHLDSEYLTVKQIKALRGQAGPSPFVLGKRREAAEPVADAMPQVSTSTSDSSSPEESEMEAEADDDRERVPFLNGSGVRFKMAPRGSEKYDLLGLFANRRSQLKNNVKTEMQRLKNVKWYACVKARLTKYDPEGNIKDQATPTFRSVTQTVLTVDTLEDQVDAAYFKISASLDSFKAAGSGWVLDEILSFEQTVLKYQPLRGSCSNARLPEILSRRRCLLNIIGRPTASSDCFLWSVIAGLHSTPDTIGEKHWTEYAQFKDELHFEKSSSGRSYMPLSEIDAFESSNNVSVHVFGYENDEVFPLYISKRYKNERHVNLLLLLPEYDLTDEQGPVTSGHYCVIQDIGRLAFRQAADFTHRNRQHYCLRCLNPKSSEAALQTHQRLCQMTEPMRVSTPEPDKKWLKFRNYQRQLEVPFIIVADFQYFTKKIYDRDEPVSGPVVRERHLEPFAFAYHRLSVDDFHPSEPVVFVGESQDEVLKKFMECMAEEETNVFEILAHVEPVTVCDRGLENMAASNDHCYIFEEPFLPGQKICVDHSHVTGLIRGNTCNRCNLKHREPNFLPILCHNLSAFDGRFIMTAVGKYGPSKVSVIPQSIDTYVAIMVNRCRYIDSKRFLNAELETLVRGIASESGPASFKYLRQFLPEENLHLFLRPQVLCCEHLDGPERLNERTLPDRAAFYDPQSGDDISDEQYRHAKLIWETLPEKSMREYVKSYLLTHVLLLSDILSVFRHTLITDLKLDPMHYYTLSGYAWDCALRQSGVVLELITDQEMYLTIETSLRGGAAVLGTPRYAKANNPSMPKGDYDPNAQISVLQFFDFNGLYTSVMKDFRLPTHGFCWLSEWEIERLDICTVPPDSDHGYIVECDLSVPEELHEHHDGMPFAPEHVQIRPEDLSQFTRDLANNCGINIDCATDIPKLCLTLKDKSHYVCHYRNLQMYLKHGLKLTKVHRVIKFVQSPFLETFMTYAGNKRRDSTSDFFKFMWKSMCNAICGKTMENVRKHKTVKICTTAEKLEKLVALPTFDTLSVFDENLTAVHVHRTNVTLNRPITVGFCVLELAKLVTYEFFYDFVKPAFKDGTVSFLAGDTDSFILKIDGIDSVDQILKENSHLFDFSNLPKGHPLKDDSNKMVPGKVKLELGDHVCLEFCALSPKCYSMKTDKGYKQAHKGSKKDLKHELYKQCLLSDSCHADDVSEIRNYGQNLYRVSATRRLLTPIDTKRYYVDRNSSISFGHYKLHQALI